MLNLYQQVENFLTKSSVVIVDIDNTIIRNGIYPIKKMVDYVNELSKTNKIYIITGRPESDRKDTEETLKKAGIKYNRLMMNNIGGSPKDQLESKRKHAESIKDKVFLAIDDNPKARNVYRKLGIRTKSPSV
jgi:archaellum biogenesis ATPase FlaH